MSEQFQFTGFELCAECLASEPGGVIERLEACRDLFLEAPEAAKLPVELRDYWFRLADELIDPSELEPEDAVLTCRNVARFAVVTRDWLAHRVYGRSRSVSRKGKSNE